MFDQEFCGHFEELEVKDVYFIPLIFYPYFAFFALFACSNYFHLLIHVIFSFSTMFAVSKLVRPAFVNNAIFFKQVAFASTGMFLKSLSTFWGIY